MFGQKSSPFLAIRTLQQLVEDEVANDKPVQNIILHDLYVDDVVTGAENKDTAIKLQKRLINIFSEGKFELRK
jgi:hypothetical protein